MPTIAQLKQAVTIAEQIEKLQAELASIVGGSSSTASVPKAATVTPAKKKGRRKMSPETILKMKAAQQARWAKKKGVPANAAAPKAEAKPAAAPKKTKGITAEGRAKLAAAMKARWAARKKAAK